MFKVQPFPMRTLSWWYDERDNIDMSPIYQRRGGLWSPKDRSFLIDSILNDFDIPKIYVADFTYVNTPLNKNNKSYAIVDGKQRFEAIFDFFDGKLLLDTDFKFFSNESLKLGGLGYRDLVSRYPKLASKFENFNLSVVSVITDEEDKINELFIRLNRSRPLTGAEIRNAMKGLVPPLLRKIVRNTFFQSCIKFKVDRGQDLNVSAKILLIEFRGEFVDTKKANLDRFAEEGMLSETTRFERADQRLRVVLNHMVDVFTDRDPLLSSPGPIPLYYWFIKNKPYDFNKSIREFLVMFDYERRENKKRFKKGLDNVDEELLSYDVMNRSVDDKQSLLGRYRILNRRFANFLCISPLEFEK